MLFAAAAVDEESQPWELQKLFQSLPHPRPQGPVPTHPTPSRNITFPNTLPNKCFPTSGIFRSRRHHRNQQEQTEDYQKGNHGYSVPVLAATQIRNQGKQ